MSFNTGSRVSLKSDPSTKGSITYSQRFGQTTIHQIAFDDGTHGTHNEDELMNEIRVHSSWDLLYYGSFTDAEAFSISNTTYKITNKLTNTISALKASRTIFKPYQYKPLIKFLKSDNQRILVADEVGLGKTIEAGHILLEMSLRGEVKNVLVVCKKSLVSKWHTELKGKFNYQFKTPETTSEFKKAIQEDSAFHRKTYKAIVNYEKLRSEKIVKTLEETGYGFDLVIIDEAQTIRNTDTKTHVGVKKILDFSNMVIMLSATPVMTEIRNLHSLVKLLDETFEDYSTFNYAISLNKPFIKALNELNKRVEPEQIFKELSDTRIEYGITLYTGEVQSKTFTTIGELYENDLLYLYLKELCASKKSRESVAKIQDVLYSFNAFNQFYTRTRKRDVLDKDQRILREPKTLKVTLSAEEKDLYQSVIEFYEDDPEMILAMITKKRMVTSCMPAFQKNNPNMGSARKIKVDSKFNALQQIIDEVVIQASKKLIIFSFFTGTLDYLEEQLERQKIRTAVIHGKRQERDKVLHDFQFVDDIKVLLTSEVGSEGIDLQFCDAIVNYDLPWNPMVVEQRIGRIDRVGQKSSVINIYNLIYKDSIEEQIHDRLYERIDLFRHSIGDLEAILGDGEDFHNQMADLENKLYKTHLTDQQRTELIDQAAQAIEYERLTLKQIESELKDAFANDLHLEEEISLINKERRYVTSDEIKRYVHFLTKTELSSLQFEDKSELEFRVSWRPSDNQLLFKFIENNISKLEEQPELHVMYGQFKARHYEATGILFTIDQLAAFNDKSLEFITPYHPLIDAAKNYFVSKGIDKNQCYYYTLDASKFGYLNPQGQYVLCTFNLNTTKASLGKKPSTYSEQRHILFNVTDDIKIANNQLKSEILALSQEETQPFPVKNISFEGNKEVFDTLKGMYMIENMKIKNEYLIETSRRFDSEVNRRYNTQKDLLLKRIDRAKMQLLESDDRMRPIREKNLREEQEKLEVLESNYQYRTPLVVKDNLVSISLILVE
jgi:superfamily II DNA or RNA helicase